MINHAEFKYLFGKDFFFQMQGLSNSCICQMKSGMEDIHACSVDEEMPGGVWPPSVKRMVKAG
jgi:hypothetical protein